MKKSSFERGLVIVLVAAIIVGAILFFTQILSADAFTKEEAQHGLYGLWIYKDINALDAKAFLYDTSRQLVWPFLHSWILGIVFFTFGPSTVVARLLSLAMFLGIAVFMYLLSAHFSHKIGQKPGVTAALLALSSPLLIRFGTANMLEALGALLFLAATYVYMLCEEQKITLEYVLLAFLIGLSLYVNYIFAYLMVASFMVATVVKLVPIMIGAIKLMKKGEKSAIGFIWWAYRKLIVLFVVLTLLGVWFSFNFSRKILILANTLFRYSSGEKLVGIIPNLLYYPKVIIDQVTFSPWLGILALVSLFLPFIVRRYASLNKLFIFVWTSLVLLVFTIPTKSAQFLYIIVPFILIIFSATIFYFKDKIKQKNPKLATAFFTILILPALFSLPNLFAVWFPANSASNMQDVLQYFSNTVPAQATMVIPLNLQHLNPEVVEFHMDGRAGAVITNMDEISSNGNYLLTIELDPDSKYHQDLIDDSLFSWNITLRDKLMRGQIKLYSTRRFDDVGVTARIFEETSSNLFNGLN